VLESLRVVLDAEFRNPPFELGDAKTFLEQRVKVERVLEGIRDDENGNPRNWGKHGNLDLHGWAFDRFITLLDYKAEAEGIDVTVESERDTSKTCSACGTKDGNQRVERGLYVCEECDTVANAD
jgi:putative transposase